MPTVFSTNVSITSDISIITNSVFHHLGWPHNGDRWFTRMSVPHHQSICSSTSPSGNKNPFYISRSSCQRLLTIPLPNRSHVIQPTIQTSNFHDSPDHNFPSVHISSEHSSDNGVVSPVYITTYIILLKTLRCSILTKTPTPLTGQPQHQSPPNPS